MNESTAGHYATQKFALPRLQKMLPAGDSGLSTELNEIVGRLDAFEKDRSA